MHIRLNTSTLKEKTIGLGLMAAYLLLSIPAWAQLETSMQCVVVNQAGNATVTWDQAADPSGVFEQYVLHCYEPSSELVLATFPIPNPTDPANPSFVNTTYDANTTELCYFVVTEGPAGSSGPSSDTLCSIHLTAEPALTPGTVDLNFNSPRIGSQSPPTFAAPPLSVELEEADGSWTEIAAIADNGGMMTTPVHLG